VSPQVDLTEDTLHASLPDAARFAFSQLTPGQIETGLDRLAALVKTAGQALPT
jgi:hypothetical protein